MPLAATRPGQTDRFAAKTIDLGNNEALSRGVTQDADGTFTALTFSRSKSGFKTRQGAERWLRRATRAA